MSSNIVITLAAIGGIAWLGFILVNALRRRGPEEIPANLSPGITDDELETRRLETGQKAAVLLSAFLAVSLPLYFLGEQDRQQGFVEQFDAESVARGQALVEEFGCFDCHGPDGTGGSASFVEQRSGVTVLWEAPSLDDVFYRYDEEEVNFWITYGRGNTPMPPWGVDGGGAMNEAQVQDIVNYLKTIQKPQSEVVAEFDSDIRATQLSRLQNAEQVAEDTLRTQRQVLADINRAPELAELVGPLAEEARQVLDAAGDGLDTDGDGLSDSAEVRLVEIGNSIVEVYRVLEPVSFDPEAAQSVEGVDDADTAEGILATLEDLVESGDYPALEPRLEVVRELLETGTVDPAVGLSEAAIAALEEIASSVTAVEAPAGDWDLSSATTWVEALEAAAAEEGAAEEVVQAAGDARAALDGGQDTDGDGLSNDAENALSTQVTEINSQVVPNEATVPGLDPTNPEGSGEPDASAAETAVGNWETLALNLDVTTNNIDNLRRGAEEGVAYLERALAERRWEIDIEGVAEAAFDGDVEKAERAVLLFNGYCARCHTAGFAAGVPFTLEAGSGGFGPALWDGRPTVQFGPPADSPEEDLLVQFIINGSEAQEPYGLNGFGSGRMPAFGQILSMEDIQLISQYLRGGDLTGMGEGSGS